MIKRIAAIILLVLMILSTITSCSKDDKQNTSSISSNVSSNSSSQDKADDEEGLTQTEKFVKRSEDLYNLITATYWNPHSLKLKLYAEKGNNELTTNWGYGAYISAVTAMVKLKPEDEELKNNLKNVLEGVEYFRTYRRDGYLSYSAGRENAKGTGGNDVYFDDTMWVMMDFVEAYEIFKDEQYLTKAKEVMRFILEKGWDNNVGGIYWHENGYKKSNGEISFSRNTCSNSGVIYTLCRLYSLTDDPKEKEYYLNWAIKVYDFVRNNLYDTSVNLYHDNIDGRKNSEGIVENNGVDKSRYSYNDGVMMSASIQLYKITNDSKYLEHAKTSGIAASKQYIFKNPEYMNKLDMQSHPWFNQLLIQGFIDLYPYDNDIANEALDKVISVLDYAYKNNRDSRGFISKEWLKGWSKSGDKKVEVIYQAGTNDALAEIAYFLKYIKK